MFNIRTAIAYSVQSSQIKLKFKYLTRDQKLVGSQFSLLCHMYRIKSENGKRKKEKPLSRPESVKAG